MDINSITDILKYVPSHYNKMEKARFLYIELGKYSHFDPLFKYYSMYGVYEYFNSVTNYQLPNITICVHLTNQYRFLLNSVGIKTDIKKTSIDEYDGSYHPILHFYDDNGKRHQTDLVYDLHRIQINSKTRHFAPSTLSDEEREKLDEHIGYISEKNRYSNDNWRKLQFILDNDPSLSLQDKVDYIFKYSKTIYDFSKIGIYEQATIYRKLFTNLLPEHSKNFDFSISKDSSGKHAIGYAVINASDIPSCYLYDEEKKTYIPTTSDVIDSLERNDRKPILKYVPYER